MVVSRLETTKRQEEPRLTSHPQRAQARWGAGNGRGWLGKTLCHKKNVRHQVFNSDFAELLLFKTVNQPFCRKSRCFAGSQWNVIAAAIVGRCGKDCADADLRLTIFVMTAGTVTFLFNFSNVCAAPAVVWLIVDTDRLTAPQAQTNRRNSS
jgi:hypothetical protein